MNLIMALIVSAALSHHVSPQMMLGMGGCESGFNPHNRANYPYVGLYQLSPDNQADLMRWADRQGVPGDVEDPAQQANWTAEKVVEGRAYYLWPNTFTCRMALP